MPRIVEIIVNGVGDLATTLHCRIPSSRDGDVTITAGTNGITAASANNTFAEIATTGLVTLNTTGPIGTSTNRIQFDAANTPSSVVIGGKKQPGSGVFLGGLGNLTLGAIRDS